MREWSAKALSTDWSKVMLAAGFCVTASNSAPSTVDTSPEQRPRETSRDQCKASLLYPGQLP